MTTTEVPQTLVARIEATENLLRQQCFAVEYILMVIAQNQLAIMRELNLIAALRMVR